MFAPLIAFGEELLVAETEFVTQKAVAFVSNTFASFVSKGAAGIRSSIASVSQSMSGGFTTSITSWTTTTLSGFTKNVSNLLNSRSSSVKMMNPRATLKNTIVTQMRGKNTSARTEGAGFNEFADVIDSFSANIANIVTIESTYSAEVMRKQLMEYPPAINGSLYQRTFALQQGWETAVISFDLNANIESNMITAVATGENSTTTTISNDVIYTKWVQRRATQATVHRGRWNTVEDLADQESINLANRIQSAIDSLLN